MDNHEIDHALLAAPSVRPLYGPNSGVIGEAGPGLGEDPLVEAYINGQISGEEYFALGGQRTAANNRLMNFMYGNRPPDFMPPVSRWRGWLEKVLGTN